MDVSITCECGARRTVSDGAAGTRFTCACGRAVSVPSLAELRMRAGLSAVPVSPESRIRADACRRRVTRQRLGVASERPDWSLLNHLRETLSLAVKDRRVN